MTKKWPPDSRFRRRTRPQFFKREDKQSEHRVDPRLEINLQKAGPTDQLMAIFHLDNVGQDEFRNAVSAIIREIRSQTRIHESLVSIHPAQGFFSVKAVPVFLRAIIKKAEISKVLDNNPDL